MMDTQRIDFFESGEESRGELVCYTKVKYEAAVLLSLCNIQREG